MLVRLIFYIPSHYLLWPICFGLIRGWVATLVFSVVSFHKAKISSKTKQNKVAVLLISQKPHGWVADQVGIKHSTGSWRPAPSAKRVPSWSDHRAGSSPKLQTSWSTRRAPLHGAWCKGCRWSSWRCGMVRECGIKGSGYAERRMRGKNREDRHVIVFRVKQRSSQFKVSLTALKTQETLGCVSFCWQTRGLTHLALYCVFMGSRVCRCISMCQWERLFIENNWSFHGTWSIRVYMSRMGAKLWRGRGELSKECGESAGFESQLIICTMAEDGVQKSAFIFIRSYQGANNIRETNRDWDGVHGVSKQLCQSWEIQLLLNI